MNHFNSHPLTSTRLLKQKVSSATQTMLSLHLGPKVDLESYFTVLTPEIKRQKEERREKIKQAIRDEKRGLESED